MLSLPGLSPWQQQLAGNLPLLSLIEFIDMRSKLHVLELSGSISFWNWPITPAGGRLLLSARDEVGACYLDQAGCGVNLTCIDGRYGDQYHSASSATVRLCVSQRITDVSVTNDSGNVRRAGARKQKLNVIQILRQGRLNVPRTRQEGRSFRKTIKGLWEAYAVKYWIVSAVGWLCWTTMTVLCLAASLHLAIAYLLLMPLTGMLAHIALGGAPRQLLNSENTPYQRLVVAAENLNGVDWLAFYGQSITVNSLLNRPLYRNGNRKCLVVRRHLLRIAILSQWVTALGSTCLQDWNALVISFWIAFCACISTYAYTPEESAQDWLRLNCGIVIQKISAEFSSRRSMLSCLVYLNPDKNQVSSSEWINPILAPCRDRTDWETNLQLYMETGNPFAIFCFEDSTLTVMDVGDGSDEVKAGRYWWTYIVEGVDMGKRIEKALQLSLVSTV